jgi:acyl-CoA reductase-like NAD-dependent aldehyde dehydrogenase
MKIKEVFSKDIFRPINGVVKADQHDDAIVWQELDEYVITGAVCQGSCHLKVFI